MDQKTILVLGSNGQLGRALAQKYPGAQAVDKDKLDITDQTSIENYDWSKVKVILNAAAYTDVDGAETPDGKTAAKKVNDEAVGYLAKVAGENNITLVHISTDYVFDGTKKHYSEDDAVNPLGVYGKTKAAGDKMAAQTPKHYIVRASWVIGDGNNFVRTMLGLGKKGISPTVVADQTGRPTFTNELADAIEHLLTTKASYGTYNMTNEGDPVSWADFTREIFKDAGYKLKVTNTTTAEYFASKPNAAPRPLNSTFDLSKLEATGFKPRDWQENLREYIKKEVHT